MLANGGGIRLTAAGGPGTGVAVGSGVDVGGRIAVAVAVTSGVAVDPIGSGVTEGVPTPGVAVGAGVREAATIGFGVDATPCAIGETHEIGVAFAATTAAEATATVGNGVAVKAMPVGAPLETAAITVGVAPATMPARVGTTGTAVDTAIAVTPGVAFPATIVACAAQYAVAVAKAAGGVPAPRPVFATIRASFVGALSNPSASYDLTTA